MPRRIQNTNAPRNPVARSPLMRRGGVHQRSRTSERQSSRAQLRDLIDGWQDELDDLANQRSEPGDDND